MTTAPDNAQLEKPAFHFDSALINRDSEEEVSGLLNEYTSAGFSLVPLMGKAPFEKDWPKKPGITIDEAKKHLDSDGNIGMRTGNPSGGIFGIDVDHNWEQFAKDNADLLSRVRWIRTRNGRGRVLVRGDGWKKVNNKQSWGELLGDAHQSVLPPSTNPDTDENEPYTWQGDPSLPIVLNAEPEDFKFSTPLKTSVEPTQFVKTGKSGLPLPQTGLSVAEVTTLRQIEEVIGYGYDDIRGKEAYFRCPRHQPDTEPSFSYHLSSQKFSCFHGEEKLHGKGVDDLKRQLNRETWSENPANILLSDSLSLPPTKPVMILDDLWSEATIGMITGDGGIGKTHFTLQLVAMIAGGGEIRGIPFRCPTPRNIVYISQEDEEAFLSAELFGQNPVLRKRTDVTDRIRIISTSAKGENLFLTDDRSWNYIAQYLSEGCVFILDSWSTFLTSNENDNTELQKKEITSLRRLMKARKANPLIIHHRPKRNPQTGYQASSRGGTVLPNASRFHIMLDGNIGGAVVLSFEKVSRGARPESISLVFDEERRLFVPKELDRYVTAVEIGEKFTTSQFAERIGKNPKDDKEKKQTLDILRNRSKGEGANFEKLNEGKKAKDAEWERVK